MNECRVYDLEKFKQDRLIQKAINDFDKARGPSVHDTVAMHKKLTELINGLGQIISTYEKKGPNRPVSPRQ